MICPSLQQTEGQRFGNQGIGRWQTLDQTEQLDKHPCWLGMSLARVANCHGLAYAGHQHVDIVRPAPIPCADADDRKGRQLGRPRSYRDICKIDDGCRGEIKPCAAATGSVLSIAIFLFRSDLGVPVTLSLSLRDARRAQGIVAALLHCPRAPIACQPHRPD
jgi:hypothetical protein